MRADECYCRWDRPLGPLCPDCGGWTIWLDSPDSEGSDDASIRERWPHVLAPGNHDHEQCCRYLHCAHPTCCGYYGEPRATPNRRL